MVEKGLTRKEAEGEADGLQFVMRYLNRVEAKAGIEDDQFTRVTITIDYNLQADK